MIHAGFVRRCATSSRGVPPPHLYGRFGDGWTAEILDYGLSETCGDRVVDSFVPEFQWDAIGSWRMPGSRFQCEWNSQNRSVGGSLSGLLLSLILVAASWLMWYPARASAVRRARNQCVGCGYDLRGLAVEAACPECGGS